MKLGGPELKRRRRSANFYLLDLSENDLSEAKQGKDYQWSTSFNPGSHQLPLQGGRGGSSSAPSRADIAQTLRDVFA